MSRWRRSSVRGLVVATHLGPTVAVTTIATILCLGAGLGRTTVLVTATVLAGQFSVGWSNDLLDARRDLAAARTAKPVVAGLVTTRQLRWAAMSAGALSIGISLSLGWRAAVVNALGLCSAWSYNLGLKATVASPLPYAASFALLPALITMSLPAHSWPRPVAMVAAACLGVGAHFINTIKDVDADRTTGVRGLPQRLGPRASLLIGAGALAAALAAIVLLAPAQRWSTWVLASVAVGADVLVIFDALRGSGRRAWSWTLVSALCCVVLFASSGSALVATASG